MKVAVLGAGGMGGGVISELKKIPEVTGIIAMDVRPERVEQLRKEGVTATTNLREALEDPEVGVAFVTSSNVAHKELTLAAFEHNKAVLCEKPIATTLKDSRFMVEEAERRKQFFQIGFELRYSSMYTQIKKWIDEGLLGTVVNTRFTYMCSEFHGKGSWRNKLATGGSMFGEKLCHYVDLPRWWVGSPVKDVYTVCAPNVVPYYEVRDNYHTTYRFESGAVSQISFVMYMAQTFGGDPLKDILSQQQGDGHELRCHVIGTKGAAEGDAFYRTLKRWEFGDSPKSMTSKLAETIRWDHTEDNARIHNGTDQTIDVIRRVREGRPPMTPARDALETMRLVFAADLSADRGEPVAMKSLPED